MQDECTEPVVRENLELQERLVANEQAKVDLEDRLSATRSEVLCLASPADLCAGQKRKSFALAFKQHIKCSELYTDC